MWLEVALIVIGLLVFFLIIALIVYMYTVYREAFYTYYQEFQKEQCAKVPDPWYRGEIIIPADPSVYQQELAMNLVDICTAVSFSNCDNVSSIPNPPGTYAQERITGLSPVSGKEEMYAYTFSGVDYDVIAFTGTYSLDEWRSDLTYRQVPPTQLNNYQDGMLVHAGFYGIYTAIREKLWSWYQQQHPTCEECHHKHYHHHHHSKPLFITGLSLGGALSQLAGLDFASEQPIVYSYAAPRSGNPVYAQTYNQLLANSFRVYNTEDIVVALPPAVIDSWIYEHTGRSVPFTAALGSLYDDHTAVYRYNLPTCFPNVAVCIAA